MRIKTKEVEAIDMNPYSKLVLGARAQLSCSKAQTLPVVPIW